MRLQGYLLIYFLFETFINSAFSATLKDIQNLTKRNIGNQQSSPNAGKSLVSTPSVVGTNTELWGNCAGCQAALFSLRLAINFGASDDFLKAAIKAACLTLQPVEVCEGLARSYANEVIYVLRHLNMSGIEICSFIDGAACGYTYIAHHDWDIALLPNAKPKVKTVNPPPLNAKTLKVLQISDTHYDPLYQEGTNAACKEPLCCRAGSGRPTSPAQAAGKWGNWRCDAPKRTIDHMLEHIRETHPDIDYILWTGDLTPHDIWNQTRESHLAIIRESVNQMAETFPGIPIFPALGNHESTPVNSFAPPSAPEQYSISWLYDDLQKQWRRWLPDGVSNDVRRGAFYSVLVKPKFRIISVNMNYCNNKNWWLMINSTDPVNELQWLIQQLQKAEINKEKVHIIGHIPPGSDDCLKVWSRNYYKIINRFESTIAAQFFGHTHLDEFEVFYDTLNASRPVSIAYIGPSVTPHENLNPGYRIYYVDDDGDESTRMVVDHETWIMNLTEANLYDSPSWQKLYSVREAYQMASLLPKDWDLLIKNMTVNRSLFDLYYKHHHKDSPIRPPCDRQCRKKLLCNMRSGRSYDREYLCGDLQ